MLEISVAGSAWPSTAASDWGLGRSVQGEVELGSGAGRLKSGVDLDQGSRLKMVIVKR